MKCGIAKQDGSKMGNVFWTLHGANEYAQDVLNGFLPSPLGHTQPMLFSPKGLKGLKYDGHMPSKAKRSQVKGVRHRPSSPVQSAYPVPVVSDKSGVLTLHFGSDFIQSQMVVGKPDLLALAYTRTMMAFEAFLPLPRKIALIGLGGGSIAKWCYRHHPKSRLTVVEVNPHVIAVRGAFGVPRGQPEVQNTL